jgi:endonuclease-3 related protein
MLPRSITLGRVASIPIRLHWSWVGIFVVLVAALRPVYAEQACGGPAVCGADLALAALMALLIGASVLLHELGHALTARRLTVPVESITLFAFGGVAEVRAEAPGPGAEFAIAVAGPAVSLLIAVAGGLLWWAGLGADVALLAILAAHLALANAIMAVFNLLPGYPMDGGRVLRATLWFLADDMLPATRVATQVGRACGLLIGLGGATLAILARSPLLALWAAAIGYFLYRTASGSYRQIMLQSVLRDVSVADLMQRRFRTVAADLTLDQFVARYVLGQAETGFAVTRPGEGADADPILLGLMTLRNLRRHTTAQWEGCRVSEAMTPLGQLRSLAPQVRVIDALDLLNEGPDEIIPITDGPRLVGILRRRDVVIYAQVQMARRGRMVGRGAARPYLRGVMRLIELYTALRDHFGPLHGPDARRPWWPLFSDDPATEILVGAVLVQQTRWETVEAATRRLLALGLLSPPALAAADPEALAALIRPAAFHSQKAPGLIAIARHICARYGGSTAAMLARPSAELRADLLTLPRVGPETCDAIMLYGGGHPVFVVDEYTRRLLERVATGDRGQGTGDRGQANLWRRPYEQVRLAIEAELSSPAPGLLPLAPFYADFHAQINEACVRYCLSRPRCDGPPARRVYSIQQGRESYLASDAGCPLRAMCAWYRAGRVGEERKAEI